MRITRHATLKSTQCRYRRAVCAFV